MKHKCWICFDECSDKVQCNCINTYAYCHNQCLNQWYITSKINYCQFCKNKYSFSLYLKIYVFFSKWINEIYDSFEQIGEYNLYTGMRWDEEI
jgi:hypothetical protein